MADKEPRYAYKLTKTILEIMSAPLGVEIGMTLCDKERNLFYKP